MKKIIIILLMLLLTFVIIATIYPKNNILHNPSKPGELSGYCKCVGFIKKIRDEDGRTIKRLCVGINYNCNKKGIELYSLKNNFNIYLFVTNSDINQEYCNQHYKLIGVCPRDYCMMSGCEGVGSGLGMCWPTKCVLKPCEQLSLEECKQLKDCHIIYNRALEQICGQKLDNY